MGGILVRARLAVLAESAAHMSAWNANKAGGVSNRVKQTRNERSSGSDMKWVEFRYVQSVRPLV